MSEEIKKEKIRKVFLDDLPRRIYRGRNCIDWNSSIGMSISFEYEGIKGELYIIGVEGNYIFVRYLDNPICKIFSSHLTEGKIGNPLGIITDRFKVEIGTILKDDKRDITITNRELRKNKSYQNRKWYKYTCNKCRWTEGWIIEDNLLGLGQGCSCCDNKVVVEHINSIVAKEEMQWMIPYFQGGYDEAKKYTKCSNKMIYPICPECGNIKDKKVKINGIYKNKGIHCICSDNIPYPEKITSCVLSQLGIDFKTQLTSTIFKWCKKYRYDFYFKYNNEEFIIETNGNQHYIKSFETCGGDTLEAVKENDKLKKDLALFNGIKEENYIIIDCRKSELEFIKNNILNSRLSNIFNLSKMDWNKCEEFALSNLVKEVCDIKNNNPHITTGEIGKIMNINFSVIASYLKRGNGIWCHYDAKEEKHRVSSKTGKASGKKVEIFKDDISLGMFPSCTELERQSEKLFGVNINHGEISRVCSGKQLNYKGFTFKYVGSKDINK